MFALMTSLVLICAAATFAAALVVAQRRVVANVARRFVRLPRVEQALLAVAVCVMTVCAQKSGTNEVPGAEGEVLNAEVGEAQSHGEEDNVLVERRSGVSPLQEEEGALLNRSGETLLPLSSAASASPSLGILRVNAPQAAVTTNDIARGFAFVEARTNAAVSYEMPTNGTVVGTWHKTGTYEDVAKVEMWKSGNVEKCEERFSFPMGDVCITSLWVYTWGKVRSRLRDRAHEIVAVGFPMSCMPGEGRLWTAAATNGSWVITWENFRAGREILNAENEESQRRGEEESTSQGGSGVSPLPQEEGNLLSRSGETPLPLSSVASATSNASMLRAKSTDPISAQIELFPNGDFITRSNDVERVYRRVNSDDWDDDGIANESDDDPLVAADTPQFGPNQDLSVIEHEENYCWIDLVVPQANAKVMFTSSQSSNLADPSFIAKAGETNRVMLLIGKTYHATCAFPFEIVGQSSASIEVRRPSDRAADICWPVKISVDGQNSSSSANVISEALVSDTASVNASVGASVSTASFTMSVDPACLDGVFAWANVCCSISGGALTFSYSCLSSCPCTGCTSSGYYVYEGYRIGCVGGTCGCLPSGGPPHESANVSVSFSKNVIIFEDEYEASEGVMVARRSTRTTLVCSTKGGSAGGVATFEIEGASRLTKISGRSLPFSRTLGANETFSTQILYEGKSGSGVQPKVTAKFVSSDSKDSDLASSAELTVAQIQIVPSFLPEGNTSPWRHKFGVREKFGCKAYPDDVDLKWVVLRGGPIDRKGNYQCPTYATTNPVKAVCGDAEFTPSIEVVEPSGIVARSPECETYGVSAGRAGWIGLKQELYVLPLDVSFGGIQMEEVPSSVGQRAGYFAHSSFSSIGCHSETMGAGVWNGVSRENRMGDHDIACLTTELMRVDVNGDFTEDASCGWADGWITWAIPFGWTSNLSARYHADVEPEKTFDPGANQRFTITPTGSVTVEKFGNVARRDIDGKVFCNGTEREVNE